jgi:hypothetical protein
MEKGNEQYRVEILNRCPALEKLGAEEDINRTWETIRENLNISGKERLGY